jgi:ABC-type transport system involved in multi-copper enzyme maturation permease subunit
MTLENPVPAFAEWIGGAWHQWLLVVGCLAVAALLLGFLVALFRHGPRRALRMTERTLGESAADLLLISPRRIGALAYLAIKESIRHRVILVGFLLFVLILLFASWFLDPNSTEPARLYMNAVLTTSSYLVLLLMLFLSVFSLPNDIRARTLHTVVTKPVRPSEVVLGRMLGFILMGSGLLVVMGFISYFFVVRGLEHKHALTAADLKPAGPATADGQPLKGTTSSVYGHRHAVYVDAKGQGRIETEHRHWHGLKIDGSGEKAVYAVGPEEGSLVARVPFYGTLAFRDNKGFDTDKGISVGHEWTYRSYIEGGSPAAAIWTLSGLRPEMFEKKLPVDMNIEVFRTHKGNIERGVLGSLAIRNPDTGLYVEIEIFESKEFAIKQLDIPTTLVRKKVTGVQLVQRKIKGADGSITLSPATVDASLAQRKEDDEIDFYKELVTKDGKTELWLRCVEPGQYFGAAQADLYLRAPDASFTLNFVKGYVGIWLQMLLVIGFGVMFSTFLSGPVAMIATIGALLGGMFNPFMAKVASGEQLGGGPFEAMVRLGEQTNLVVDLQPTLGTNVAKAFDVPARYAMKAMSSMLPTFGDFSYAEFVADGYNIDVNTMLVRCLQALAFFLPVFVAGYFFLKTREVAR